MGAAIARPQATAQNASEGTLAEGPGSGFAVGGLRGLAAPSAPLAQQLGGFPSSGGNCGSFVAGPPRVELLRSGQAGLRHFFRWLTGCFDAPRGQRCRREARRRVVCRGMDGGAAGSRQRLTGRREARRRVGLLGDGGGATGGHRQPASYTATRCDESSDFRVFPLTTNVVRVDAPLLSI